jgi:large subunit ribosomal protein L33
MAKADKETVFLVSSGSTGFFYSNRKNKKKLKGERKMSLKKYDPTLRKHVLFEEKKLSKLKRGGKAQSSEAAKPEGKGKTQEATKPAEKKLVEKKQGEKKQAEKKQAE